jgi:hypothetical protein
MGYGLQEFELSPVQLGVPNLRARYFALAKAPGLSFASKAGQGQQQQQQQVCQAELQQQGYPGHVHKEPPSLPAHIAEQVSPRIPRQHQQWQTTDHQHQSNNLTSLQEPQHARIPAGTEGCWPLGLFLEEELHSQVHLPQQQSQQDQHTAHSSGTGSNVWQRHAISWEKLVKFWRVLDVVTPASRHTNCFTKVGVANPASSILSGCDAGAGTPAACLPAKTSTSKLRFDKTGSLIQPSVEVHLQACKEKPGGLPKAYTCPRTCWHLQSYSKNLIASGSVLASHTFVDAFCR